MLYITPPPKESSPDKAHRPDNKTACSSENQSATDQRTASIHNREHIRISDKQMDSAKEKIQKFLHHKKSPHK
jgi:hypothetical protein